MAKILYAEDDSLLREIFITGVVPNFPGMEVVPIESGRALEDVLSKGVEDLRLVVTDNTMPPGSTGLEIIEKYARAPGFEKIPFVLYYGGEERIGESAISAGALAYLNKPCSIDSIIGVVKHALESSRESSR
jgi:DNA-binding NtrC family response regulator